MEKCVTSYSVSACHQVLIRQEFLASQTGMDRRKGPFVIDASTSGLHKRNQLRSIFIARLAEMHGCHPPTACSFSRPLRASRSYRELISCAEGRAGSMCHWPPCSSDSNSCSQMVRSVVTAGRVFSQSAVLAASNACSSVTHRLPLDWHTACVLPLP